MKIKTFIFSLIFILSISQVAFAYQIDCGDIDTKSIKIASIDCSKNVRTVVKPAQVNVKEPSISNSRGITNMISSIKQDIKELINWAAEKVGISPRLLGAVASAESSFDQEAKSPSGAIGIMQLMPTTAKSLGVNPYDQRENVLGGAIYLKQQLDKYQGNIPKALAAYNAGPGAVDKWGGIPPFAETQKYISKVMANLR